MKFALFFIVSFVSLQIFAQDGLPIIKGIDEKTYDPRLKGLTDIVVEIVNPSVTKQLNDQGSFGHINELVFKIYWTAQPERVGVDIIGLPEGFKEIKEELKMMIVNRLEHILPKPLEAKLSTYNLKLVQQNPPTVSATDKTHLSPVLEYVIQSDAEKKIVQMISKKPIGLITTKFTTNKYPWTDGKFVIEKIQSDAQEGPQQTFQTSETSYQVVQGIGVPLRVTNRTKQIIQQPDQQKPLEREIEEVISFNNYKINTAAAMKWFLSQGPKK